MLKDQSRRIVRGGGGTNIAGVNGAENATWTVDGVEHVMLQKLAPPTISFPYCVC